jgi:hypothetical protein
MIQPFDDSSPLVKGEVNPVTLLANSSSLSSAARKSPYKHYALQESNIPIKRMTFFSKYIPLKGFTAFR